MTDLQTFIIMLSKSNTDFNRRQLESNRGFIVSFKDVEACFDKDGNFERFYNNRPTKTAA